MVVQENKLLRLTEGENRIDRVFAFFLFLLVLDLAFLLEVVLGSLVELSTRSCQLAEFSFSVFGRRNNTSLFLFDLATQILSLQIFTAPALRLLLLGTPGSFLGYSSGERCVFEGWGTRDLFVLLISIGSLLLKLLF